MDLFKIGFLTVRLIDLIDIGIVTFLLYKLYHLLRGGVAINIFIGLLTVYALYWICVKVLNMELLGTILGQFISLGFIALIIVFQQEIRRFLVVLGTNNILAKSPFTRQLLPWNWQTQRTPLDISAIVKACRQMSKDRTGAIIVLAKSSELKYYANTGDLIDAEISQRLIESVFFKNSPCTTAPLSWSTTRSKPPDAYYRSRKTLNYRLTSECDIARRSASRSIAMRSRWSSLKKPGKSR